MANGSNDRRWGDVIFRTVLMALVVANLTATGINAVNNARTDATVLGHFTAHPDIGLTARMNVMQLDHNDLERRVRIMEIRLGTYSEDE